MKDTIVEPSEQASHSVAARIGQVWRSYLTVRSDDLVRQTLNRGLLISIALFMLLNLAALCFAIGTRSLVISLSGLLFLIIGYVAVVFTRQGSTMGALLIALFVAVSNAFIFLPETYVNPPVIHVSFLISTVIMTLFIRPQSVVSGVGIQLALLSCALLINRTPAPIISSFLFYAVLDLLAIAAPLYVGARVFHRTIRHLAQINQELDARVGERTAELQRVMGLREQDITAAVHDINNRMTVVRAEIDELLLDSGNAGVSPQVVGEADQRISSALNSVSALIDDLRTAVLLDNQALQLQLEPLSLPNLARKVVDQLSRHATLTNCVLSLDLHDHLPLIAGDEHKIERVLVNLVGNALKYTRQMPIGQREVRVQLTASQGSVLTTIADTGPGLDTRALTMLGQPFTRFSSARGTEGMGLGVYISRGIVEHHGGWVGYTSDGPGQGTIVSIWLPAYIPASA